MASINNRIKKLEPHVMGIRFNQGLSVIDANFKTGWHVPKTNSVSYEQLKDKPTYYMLYGVHENISIDDLLDYVETVIRLNLEREQKYELLKIKKKELEELFKVSSLEKCKTIKFTYSIPESEKTEEEQDEEMSMDDMPINYTDAQPKQSQTTVSESLNDDGREVERDVSSDVDRWNEQMQRMTDENPMPTATVGGETFDLPPRNKPKRNDIVVEEYQEPQVVCKCDPNDPNQVCPACIDSKF